MEETRLQIEALNDESGALTPDAVASYLADHPDFLTQHPDLLDVLTPPTPTNGGSVVDLQQFMVNRLRGEIDNLRECAQSLIETSRDNLSHQSRTHSAAIALLSADGFEAGARAVINDLPTILDLDAASFGFETAQPARTDLAADGVRVLPEGAVDHLLGENREVRLIAETSDDGTVFGADASKVSSCALIRLHVRDARGTLLPPGILALGARDAGTFQPGQGTDLITFLARVLEKCARQWTKTP